jgi:hypothetical protein
MMKNIKQRERFKMTESEKKSRKEAKRVREARELLHSQYSIKGFHRIFTYEGDEDGAIREAEVREADRKISELQKQL